MYWTYTISNIGYDKTKVEVIMYSKYSARRSSNGSHFLMAGFLVNGTYRVGKISYSLKNKPYVKTQTKVISLWLAFPRSARNDVSWNVWAWIYMYRYGFVFKNILIYGNLWCDIHVGILRVRYIFMLLGRLCYCLCVLFGNFISSFCLWVCWCFNGSGGILRPTQLIRQ